MPDGNYCQVQDVKKFLFLKPGVIADDGLIQTLLDGVSEEFRVYMGRELLTNTYIETRSGTGTKTIAFRVKPVTELESVQIGPPGNLTTLSLNTQYSFSDSQVMLQYGIFTPGFNNVVLSYTAGYDTIPKDVVVACAKATAYRYLQAQRLGQTSMSMMNQTVNYDTDPFPKDVTAVLDRYKSLIPL